MENINIIINKKTRQVNLSKSVIGNDGENLQDKLVFSFNDEFVDGTARLELVKQGTVASYIMLTKVGETYELPVRSIMTKAGRINMQLVITVGTNDEEIPVFKSNEFYVVVGSSINAEIEEPEDPTYPQWIDVANTKLNQIDSAITEVNNLDITASKSGTTTTITLTDKEGETSTVSILDGVAGSDGTDGITPTIGDNGNWYLGETDTGKPSRGIQGETGATGASGSDGVDGISPTVTTSKSGGATTITITDKNGNHTATINDGTNGTNGTDGADGFSPIANVTQSNNVTTISITDKVGTTTASIDLSNVGGDYIIDVDSITYNNPLIISNLKPGMYALKTNNIGSKSVYVKATSQHEITTFNLSDISFYYPFIVINNQFTPGKWAFYYVYDNNRKISRFMYSENQNTGLSSSYDNYPIFKTYRTDSNTVASTNTFTGTNTFNSLPKLSSYSAPTQDTEFAPKKYVDDKIGDINTILATLTTPSNNS